MKELSIEEKAKRYDEILVKLQEAKVDNDVCDERYCCVIDNIVPELKESEDEIRKRLIEYFSGFYDRFATDRNHTNVRWEGLEVKKVLAWLEKQGEHEDKEECEEWIKMQHEQKTPEESLGVSSEEYNKIVDECIFGDPQVMYDNAKMMFIRALEKVEEQSNKGYKLTECDKNTWWEDFKTGTSCIFEQKPAWIEEDKAMLDFAIRAVGLCRQYAINHQVNGYSKLPNVPKRYEELQNWLKSLKERYTWKPSEE